MKTLFIIIILITLFVMTALIVSGIVLTVKGKDSKKFIIAGMVSGVVPLVLASILIFCVLKGIM